MRPPKCTTPSHRRRITPLLLTVLLTLSLLAVLGLIAIRRESAEKPSKPPPTVRQLERDSLQPGGVSKP